jgi:hypothetical protein
VSERQDAPRKGGALVGWLRQQNLLRGPYLFVDYWANVLGLEGVVPDRHSARRFIDLPLFRLGVDRPDLEIPRLRSYVFLFLVGPFLVAFRFFRRLGQYRLGFRSPRARQVQESLDQFRLDLRSNGDGRVDVGLGETTFARHVLDPYLVSGYSSLFWAANKLPLASFSAILLVAIMTPVLHATHLLDVTLDFWVLLAFPGLVLLMLAVYREWTTAVLGALPVVIGRYLWGVLGPSGTGSWATFFWSLAGLYLLYLLADWFFMPRPVPPALLLYTADGEGRPYDRGGDAPYWLEGRTYWVWRYLLLSPAELNKFWERDWERVELWIRADGPDAGALEWVVTDLHYRELWIPYESFGSRASLQRSRMGALHAAAAGEPGVWVVETDADLVFHFPIFRALSFQQDTEGIPVHGIRHVLGSLWKRVADEQTRQPMRALERIRMETGVDVLGDLPEIIAPLAARKLLSQPWRYWRYPLGVARRREHRLYENENLPRERPLAAPPDLQIKAQTAPRPRHARGESRPASPPTPGGHPRRS